MKKIIDFRGIIKYFCINCKHFHIRKYGYKLNDSNERIKTKDTPFFNHQEFGYKLSSSERFNLQMNRSLNNYSIKAHKLTRGSRKQ